MLLAMAIVTIAPAISVATSGITALRQQSRSSSASHEASRLSSSARRSSNLRTAPQQKPRKPREDFSCRAASFTVTLRTPQGEKTLSVPDDVYILDAAEDMGFPLPYSCRSGACSSCAALVKEGKIDQSNQNYLEESQVQEGYVLTCVAYPLSDVILETHQEHGLY